MADWLEYFRFFLSEKLPEYLSQSAWNYKDDLCVIGSADLAYALHDITWLTSINSSADWLVDKSGRLCNWNDEEYSLDKISCGKSLDILFAITGEENYRILSQQVVQHLIGFPRTSTHNFWHKDIYFHQMWADGLYMVMPYYANHLDKNDACWDDICNQFVSADRLLWDTDACLYHHGYDSSRHAYWADPETGRSPSFWLRAEAWFLMALVDTYESARAVTPRAHELAELLQKAVQGLIPYADETSYLYFQVIDQPDHVDNYPETSGSAMVAYVCMKGARLGVLPELYRDYGSAILEGIRTRYLKVSAAGMPYLEGICASAGLGYGPDNRRDRTGTCAYYLSEKTMRDNQHGAAACMMAYSEFMRMTATSAS